MRLKSLHPGVTKDEAIEISRAVRIVLDVSIQGYGSLSGRR